MILSMAVKFIMDEANYIRTYIAVSGQQNILHIYLMLRIISFKRCI